ncbi:hypothetical protein [Patulibacter sp.]|uniref:phosphorylase family protein n=1 Tax=Patulibacter sp. TaxID=1912859 RepID=UPI00272333D4|nr:hypothetical protein [Patulibacter sp.]MDO9410711.1 hypothetical protein [Patulibacter sp.]
MTPTRTLPPLLRVGHPVADRAILVGDPGRALALAQVLLARPPLMSNHARGLWGYTGTASDDAPLSVLSTGTGGPSAAAVLREAVDAGVRRVVRAGSAVPAGPGVAPPGPGGRGADPTEEPAEEPAASDAATGPSSAPAALRAVSFAVSHDGTSAALGRSPGEEVRPDGGLLDRLRGLGLRETGVVSVDLLPADGGPPPPLHRGAGAVDRQSAAVLAAAERLGVPAAVVLAFPHADEEEEARGAWWRAVGLAAAAALGVEAVARD